jgi:hypothetical protein
LSLLCDNNHGFTRWQVELTPKPWGSETTGPGDPEGLGTCDYLRSCVPTATWGCWIQKDHVHMARLID